MRMDFQQGELIMMITRKLTYIVSPKLEKPFPIIASLLHLAGPLRETAGFKQIWGLDQGNFWVLSEIIQILKAEEICNTWRNITVSIFISKVPIARATCHF